MYTELSATDSMFASPSGARRAQPKLPGTGLALPVEKPARPASISQAAKTDEGPATIAKGAGKPAPQEFRQMLVKRTSAHSRQDKATAVGQHTGRQRERSKNGPDLSVSVLLSVLLGGPTAITKAQPSTRTALNLSNAAQRKSGTVGSGSNETGAKTTNHPSVTPNHNSNTQIAVQNAQTQAAISADTPQKTKQPGNGSAQKTNGALVHADLNKEGSKQPNQAPGLQQQVIETGAKALKTAKNLPHTQKVSVLNGNHGVARAGQGENEHKSLLNEGKMDLDAAKPADYRIGDKLVFSESLGGKTQASVHASSSSSAKSGIIQAQVSAGQAKSVKDSTPKNASPTQPDQVPTSSNTQMRAPEQSSVVVQGARSADRASSPDVARNVSQQIAESVQSSVRQGDKQVTIHLYPPELGRVYVRFQEQENQIIGLLEVSKAETRFEVEQQLPQIIRSLHDAGVEVRKFEVLLSDQSERHADSNQLLEDDSPQQDPSTTQNSQGRDAGGEWLTGKAADGQQSNSEPQTELNDGRVNVLI
jgi:flagellar hook-length control protein FliK